MEPKEYVKSLVRESLFLEGVMDAETTNLSRKIVSLVTPILLGVGARKTKTVPTKRWELSESITGRPVLLVVHLLPTKGLTTLTASGEYLVARYKPGASTEGLPELPSDRLEISVRCPLNRIDFRPELLEPFVLELKSVLRHELEHLKQKARGYKTTLGIETDPWSQEVDTSKVFTDPEVALKYYTSPEEVEAYVMQVYRTAKMKKIPFSEALKDYIAGHLGRAMVQRMGVGPGIKVLNAIKKAWVAYARTRLPGV